MPSLFSNTPLRSAFASSTCRARSSAGLLLALILATGALTGCRETLDPAHYGKFQSAQQAFDAAKTPDDFRHAAALYQEILDQGLVSGVVLYNQGNAFMRANMRGHAVASYRRAQRYRPNDPYLEANLANAKGSGSDAERKPLIEYVLFWQDWVSFPAKFRLSSLFALGTLAIAVFGVWWGKRVFVRFSAMALLVTIALAISATYDWYRFLHLKHGALVANAVVARKGNAESYEPAFTAKLDEGTEFRVVEGRGGWILIRLAGDQEGWIPLADAVVY